MGPIVFDKSVKFRDPSLSRSREIREIPLEAVGCGIFDSFFAATADFHMCGSLRVTMLFSVLYLLLLDLGK